MDGYRSRLDSVRQALSETDSSALVTGPGPTMCYLTGVREEPSERHFLLLVSPDRATFVVPEMYDDQLSGTTPVADLRTWADGDDPTALVREFGSDLEPGRVLIDDRLWELFSREVRTHLPGTEFGLASELVADLRIVKDETELASLREAARITDRVVREVRGFGEEAIGMTEAELAAEIESRLAAAGGEGLSFEPIVGSGPNGAHPHHRHGGREIEAGDPVVLDFGTRFEGYPGDQTRTVVFGGEPPERFEEVHEVVREAQRAGVDAVEPGVAASEVDRAAREVIESAGYGEEFTHRTGHGVGLEVHEPPYVVAGNDRELEAGMVASVEPGIYLDGEFGVRIEDLVVVTEEGCERLNTTSRDWRVE
ncbi:M24 family metallopeptidase [Natronorarus salvus]|uniref:M24 family metallopeptidase n=1 Tax=Natronorarus salvus TaxID=3117733 RepID=UPI002F26484D